MKIDSEMIPYSIAFDHIKSIDFYRLQIVLVYVLNAYVLV